MNKELTKDKQAEETLFQMKQEYECLETQDSTLKKRKKRFSSFMEDWERLNREELELLEEVSFLSQGTHSEAHALQSLDEREIASRQGWMIADNELGDIDYQQRKVRSELEEAENNLDRQKKAVYGNG